VIFVARQRLSDITAIIMENEKKSTRFILSVTPGFVERVDEWRRQQPELPSRAEAIRRLVEKGLEGQRPS
jgi:metal-responsive CopG/Arc/MetJ family transcriptional regulator